MSGLAEALAAFQAEIPTVAKSKTANVPTKSGGSYSYTYADLADVTRETLPLLTKHGLSFTARPRMTERGYELVGTLLHTSGEREEGALPLAGNTPQEMGSSLTYMRRYLLGCMTGVVTDDDDDGALAQNAPPRSHAEALASAKQLGYMNALFASAGIDSTAQLPFVLETIGREPANPQDMTVNEAAKVIDRLKPMGERKAERVKAKDINPAEDPWAVRTPEEVSSE